MTSTGFAAYYPVIAASMMAAVPLYAVLRGRAIGPPAPRSLGRHAVWFAAFFAAALLGFRFASAVWTLLVYSIVIGMLTAPRVRQVAQRVLYGRAWVEAHPETAAAEAKLTFIPLFSVAIASFLFAMLARAFEIVASVTGPGGGSGP
ncbi:MAG: hypothetical protein IPG72_05380 [Ardenticatenales bacterium]|jgi:hypothetical protein|nr:hypothetical protein [Ardenticatenales bacterium]